MRIEVYEFSLVEMIRLTNYENQDELIRTRKENINQISQRLLDDKIPTKEIILHFDA